MDITLKGKVALVTGGGAGIGKAICEAFHALGAKLAIAEIDAAKCEALKRQFPDALVHQMDVREEAQADGLRAAVEAKFNRLDVLVNNVGHHLMIFGKIENMKTADWDAICRINLLHMFFVTRAMIPVMKRSGEGGSIINFSSIEGFRGFPYNVAYTTFKHAVTGFTRGLATELSSDNIRVNLIAPETTESEQVPLDKFIPAERRAAADRTIPLGRFGRPEDHAGAAVYLATSMSSWVTGTVMFVDGGGHSGNVFQRTPKGEWTNMPIVTGKCDQA